MTDQQKQKQNKIRDAAMETRGSPLWRTNRLRIPKLLLELDKSKIRQLVLPETRLQWIEVDMGIKEVINVDTSFNKITSEIQKVNGEKINHRPTGLTVGSSGNPICLTW